MIECNEIQATIEYLQGVFHKCKKLKAADMDLLVELVSTVYSCGEGNLTQDNLFLEKEVPTYFSTPANFIAEVNALDAYTVTETQIVIFTTTRILDPRGNTVVDPETVLIPERWVMLNKGKNTYGTGEEQLTTDDVLLLNPLDPRVRDLINIVYNNIQQETRILNGNVEWQGDLDFLSTDINFLFNGELYTAESDTFTLSDADATNPRIDVFAVDTSNEGELVVLEGTPAANPEEPEIDFTTQIRVGAVLINALATSPSGYSEELIYDENVGEPTEWTVSESTGGLRIDISSNDDPSTNVLSIEGTDVVNNADELTFVNDVSVPYQDNTTLAFDIKSKSTNDLFSIFIKFIDSGTNEVYTMTLNPGNYNFTGSADIYQKVLIPLNVFQNNGVSFDTIIMSFKSLVGESFVKGFYIDNVKLINGLENPDNGLHDLQFVTDNGPRTTNEMFIDVADNLNTYYGMHVVRKEDNTQRALLGLKEKANGDHQGLIVLSDENGNDTEIITLPDTSTDIDLVLPAVSGNLIVDAPVDGNDYVRNNGAWALFSGGVSDLQTVTGVGSVTNIETTFEAGIVIGDGTGIPTGITYDGLAGPRSITFFDPGGIYIQDVDGITLGADTIASGFSGSRYVLQGINAGWNALTNTPTLANTDTDSYGVFYRVTAAGTQDFGAGAITFEVGDYVANFGSFWSKVIDNNQNADLSALEPVETADTGTTISLATVGGNNCNFGSANTNTAFTTTGAVLNGWAQVLINTASQPTVSGATQEGGIDWEASTDMYMVVRNKGAEGVIFYFLSLDVNDSTYVTSDTTGEPSGSDQVLNIVSLTQAEYDAGTPVATTVYIITD